MPTFSVRQDMIPAVQRQAYSNAAVCGPLALALLDLHSSFTDSEDSVQRHAWTWIIARPLLLPQWPPLMTDLGTVNGQSICFKTQ